jgi:hypothetical protein
MGTPDMPLPSTTPPKGEPSARGSPVEPIHVKEDPASLGASGPSPASTLAGEGEPTPQQTDTGKPLAPKKTCFLCIAISSFFFFFLSFLSS